MFDKISHNILQLLPVGVLKDQCSSKNKKIVGSSRRVNMSIPHIQGSGDETYTVI